MLHPGGRYVTVSGPKDNRWLDPLPHIARTWLAFRRADAVVPPVHRRHRTSTTSRSWASSWRRGDSCRQIDRVVGLDGVADGLAEIGTGHARAKIVVVP